MSWNKQRISGVALSTAPEDYAMFEAIGLSEIEDANVLDMGCFDGFNTVLKFKPYENIASVVGVDPVEDALADARQRTDDARFSWEMGNCETYDGDDEQFDVVYFSHSFQHLADKRTSLDNVFRMLKPGGFVCIKTIDDHFKASYPDPQNVMRRLFALYDEYVLPNTPHTAHTDRYNGSKCYSLLHDAGFFNIAIRTTTTDTSGMTLDKRKALFERGTYFRRNVPACVEPSIAEEIKCLLQQWEELFEHDDYYYSSSTFLAIAQKPADGQAPARYFGPLFGGACEAASEKATQNGPETPCANASRIEAPASTPANPAAHDWTLAPMTESDLGHIMRIEVESFPDPWTPVAYAMELRYNENGTYVLARNAEGAVGGYVGWWISGPVATIANIAVDPNLRRSGVGKLLLDHACNRAKENACAVMQLQVRSANETARKFYAAIGFAEMGSSSSYYTNPDDDAIILAKPLE